VGLVQNGAAALAAAGFLCAAGLNAAPRLRLVSSTVGPVSIAQGASGGALQTQTVEAYYTDDINVTRSLPPNLSLASSVSWIVPSVGAERACSSRPGVCNPLQFALNTSALPAGTVTGIVTVSDPNAIDAPQTITITVQIGGGLPGSLDVSVAPGTTRDLSFFANSQLGSTVKTTDGGPWLSLSLDGSGSFRFPLPYRVHFAPTAGMGPGTYQASITTAGSSFAPDNKTIPVTMRVTTQPIAQPSVDRLRVRLAQGAPVSTTAITLTNLGQSTSGQTSLHVQDAKTSGAAWITTTPYSLGGLIPDGAIVTIDPKGLAPGTYSDGVVFSSNAVAYAGAQGDKTSLTVPVDLEIVSPGPPVMDFQGVLDNATFVPGDAVAPGDIVAVKGQQLSMLAPANGAAPPLSTQVADTQVLLNGGPIPLFFTSYGQINCQIPTDAPIGTSTLQVKRTDGQVSNLVTVDIAPRAPRLLLGGVGLYGTVTNQDLSRPMPDGSFPGVATHPAKPGDTLTLYAIGLGPTSPFVATGQAAPSSEPLARLTTTPTVNFGGGIGGAIVNPLFAGLSPFFAGLYQVNVTIPQDVPKGLIFVTLAFGDSTSNAVQIVIQ
jgi:uncharacterized protein (TIGR03437 family)